MNPEERRPVRVVDVRGTFCPQPIIETARAVREVEVGEDVLVVATDRGLRSDMPAWCKATGNELVSLTEKEGVVEARVRRLR